MPLTPAPLSAGLGRSAPVPAAAPGANMMATAPAAPSADSNSAAPPVSAPAATTAAPSADSNSAAPLVSAPAATASTTAAPSQPSKKKSREKRKKTQVPTVAAAGLAQPDAG